MALEPDADDGPRRDGDATIRWHHKGMSQRQLYQKELMAVLAGPAAEIIHNEWEPDIGECDQWHSEWWADWQLACQLATALVPSAGHVEPLLQFTVDRLHKMGVSIRATQLPAICYRVPTAGTWMAPSAS